MWGWGGVRIRDRRLFVFGVVGSGHTRRPYALQLRISESYKVARSFW